MRLQDYREQLKILLDGHDAVAFLKHPLARWDEGALDLILNDLEKTVLAISGNSYAHVMTPRTLGPVITISSSLGVESEIFGHDTHFLLADPREKFATRGSDEDGRVELDHRLFEPALWQQIFARSGEGIEPRPQGFYLGPDYVRGTLQDSSLKGLEGAEVFPAMEKLIMPARGIQDARVDELAGYLAHASLDDRDAAAVQARNHNIEIKWASAPLKPGRKWEWSPSIALPGLFLTGFHQVEKAGAWSNSSVCSIHVPLDAAQGMEIECEADISFFSGILALSPALLVRVDGEAAAALFHFETQGVEHRLRWRTKISGPHECIIHIECSHSARPSDLGIAPDERDLGFMLHKLSVHASLAT